jgi:hypothetical protein
MGFEGSGRSGTGGTAGGWWSVEGSDREGRRPLRGYGAAWGEETG